MKTKFKRKEYPLTSAQKLHYYSMMYCPKKQVLNIGSGLTIQVELERELLEECIKTAVMRCEALRVQFAEDKKSLMLSRSRKPSVALRRQRKRQKTPFASSMKLHP